MTWIYALWACTAPDQAISRVYPNLLVSPTAVDFGNVAVLYSSTAEVTLLNGGAVDLNISGLDLEEDGPAAFSVSPGPDDLPLVVEPDGATSLQISFSPETFLTYTGQLAITSDDEDLPTFYLPLSGVGADAPMPDIDVDPPSYDFGYVAAGSQNYTTINVTNVGEGPLNLGSVEQAAGGSGAFSLTSGNVSDFTIPAGQFLSLVVAYLPTNDAGDHGSIVIESDDPDEALVTIPLLGNGGSDYAYPVAVIDAPLTTEPRRTITFDGSGSYDPGGKELTYEWTLESKPEGSGSGGLVNLTTDTTYLPVDVAGDYVVSLKVTNTDGISGSPARHTVSAIPNEYLHVELSWDTPNADLDLHLLNGAGNYYDARNDCNYCNENPDWGETGVDSDDPSLDIDDLAGYGPENINIDAPADGYYPVMVHYFEDRSDDAVVATVRVYLNGALFDTASQVLYRDEVWTVGDIKWPDATFGIVDTVEDSELRACE